MLRPVPGGLVALEAGVEALMHGDLRHHIVAHPLRQIGIDETDDRDIGEGRVLEQRVDTGAQRQHRLEPAEPVKGIGAGLPHEGVVDLGGIVRLGGTHHGNLREFGAVALGPPRLIDIRQMQQQRRHRRPAVAAAY